LLKKGCKRLQKGDLIFVLMSRHNFRKNCLYTGTMASQAQSGQKAGERLIPTLQDVAQQARVSTATVSRALTQPDVVSKATLKRVQQAIEDTGYVVNEAARSLRRKRSGALLVMVPAVSSPFFSQVMKGLEGTAIRAGYNLLIANTEDDNIKERQLFSYVQQNRADGVLILGGRPPVQKEEVQGPLPPIVAVNERIEGISVPTVAVDGNDAAREVVRYLLGLGHLQIGHISGPRGRTSSALDRAQGFEAALQEANLQPTWSYVTEYNMESGAAAAREWISLPNRPTAVFCSCDEVAFGFNSALYRNGFRVPRDVSVVGFDDIPLAEFAIPSLTTIRQPHHQIGDRAVKLLLEQIRQPQEAVGSLFLKGELIIRESTHRFSGASA
jgi:LacI family repressor for deo operon, udp, cdd, tsx, nupC, and nupG